jgi:hypothetical protein
MGLTQEELEANFQPFIRQRAKDFGLGAKELLDLIKAHYDGFSFDGEEKLYNPFSTLSFFGSDVDEFYHYWIASGSSTLIRKFLLEKGLTSDEFRGLKVDFNFASSPGEIEKTSPEGFLYQAGYLSLYKKDRNTYFLDYPNFEVLSAISSLFMDNLFPSAADARQRKLELRQNLTDGNVPEMVNNFRRMFASLSNFDRYSADKELSEDFKAEIRRKLSENFKADLRRLLGDNFQEDFLVDLEKSCLKLVPRKPGVITDDAAENLGGKFLDLIRRKLGEKFKEDIGKKLSGKFIELIGLMFNGSYLNYISLKLGEGFYRSVLQAYLMGLGAMALPELESGLGRPDLVIRYKNRTYVLELKTAEGASGTAEAAALGMDQIRERGYEDPYDDPILVSLAVDKEKRNIGACIFERGGEVTVIDIKKLRLPEAAG